jgi:hypothetical protein
MRFFNFVLYSVAGVAIIFNGLVSYIFGDFASEGFAVFFCIALLMVYLGGKITIYPSVIWATVPVFFVIFLNFVFISANDEWYRLFFLYPYFIVLLLIFLMNSKSSVTYEKLMMLVRILVVASCVSAVYAILQRLGYGTTIPLETELRATGLSRTSLNLSGILFNSLVIAVICLPTLVEKNIAGFLLFAGLLSAGGRGAAIGALAFLIIYIYFNFKNKTDIYRVVSFFFLLFFVLLAILFLDSEVSRVFSALNFISDQSNIDRFVSYAQFLDEFNIWGAGVGSTSPAVGRFSIFTGFESFFLNVLYEIGLPMFLLMAFGFVQFLFKIDTGVQRHFFIFTLGLLPMLLGQQMHNTPSVFAYTILSYALISLKNKVDL